MEDLKTGGQFYFFGVGDNLGHFWWPRWPRIKGCPWGDDHVDSKLCRGYDSRNRYGFVERDQQIEGLARIHHKDGWTAVGYWDRTGDDRYGSNSNFVAEGTFTFEQMMEMARQHFPDVIRRTEGKFEIRLEE